MRLIPVLAILILIAAMGCDSDSPPTATRFAPPTATRSIQPTATHAIQPTSARSNCDPSYPSVCIPRYPPDLDCGEIPFRRFRVVGSDPHGFDRDRDGIGCES